MLPLLVLETSSPWPEDVRPGTSAVPLPLFLMYEDVDEEVSVRRGYKSKSAAPADVSGTETPKKGVYS